MKLQSILIATLLISKFAAAQNTFPNDGNAGIGILTPNFFFGGNGLQIEENRPTLRFAPNANGGLATILFKGKFSENASSTEDEFHFNYVSTTTNPYLVLGAYKNGPKTIMSWMGAGNLGIGTDAPQTKLDINGVLQVYNKDNQAANWDNIRIWSEGSNGLIESNGDEAGMIIRSNGGNKILLMSDVGIGTTSPTEKLSVAGKIGASEIQVRSDGWPDYVFKPEYHLPSLSEIEKQIRANGHLPEMPSAKEVETNGLAVGEMLKLQQQKIEELTLHLIQKDKEIKSLNYALEKQGKLLIEILNKLK
ncbi:hypothetical protein ACJVDH_05895 [Pedobacter sp. AW1-32]|uniref:hypothetical protein n=1 Tax=Pedobacter sp. AW1-32 TaxID=3383026 RepID=UPI003FEFF39F